MTANRTHARLVWILLLGVLSFHNSSCLQEVLNADSPAPAVVASEKEECQPCKRMVRDQISAREVRDPRVLAAMRKIRRHLFVPPEWQSLAYADQPLPIGRGQTISQPYIVAFMTEALELKPGDRVLEIGTGSGYQAAVLAELVREVYSIEIVEPLAREAETRLRHLGYTNVQVRAGDGYRGWPDAAPFDAIMVTAAPDHVPAPLLEQLALNGRLILPVGRFYQDLIRIRRTSTGLKKETLLPVRFVPMTGESERVRPPQK
jgi:protein-L-isoaspartate(D-aspartate) O-methyltransferase